MQDKTKIKGRVRLQIIGVDGKLREDTGFIDNATMNAALAVFAGLMGNTGSQTAFTFLALGTSNTAVSASQTALGAEITTNGLQRAAATVSRVTTNQTNDTLNLTKTFVASASFTVEEVGYFNASSSGVMGGRQLTTSKTVASGESIVIIYQIIFS